MSQRFNPKVLKNMILPLFLVIIMLIVFFPILTGGAYLVTGVSQNDQWLFNYPLKEFYRSQLILGKLPFWTSYIGNGYPLFAEGQVGALYPFHLILFRYLPTITAYNVNILIHFILAALFTYLFARNLALSRKASFMAAIAYSLSGFMTIHVHQVNINMVISYLPLSLLAADKLISGKKIWFSVLTASLVFQILAGHIEMFYYCAAITGGYFILRMFLFTTTSDGKTVKDVPNADKKSSVKGFPQRMILTLLLFFLSYLFAVGISFFQIMATYELSSQSQRAEGLNIEHASATLWPLETLGMFVNPRQYDLYRVEKEYTPTGDTVNIQALYGYIGIIPLLLAMVGIFLSRKRITVILTVILVFSFIYGMGRSTQLFAILWNLIPGLKFFRFPTKIMFLVEFCLAVLAGIGFDTISQKIKTKTIKTYLGYMLIPLSLLDLLYFNAFGTRKIINAEKWLETPESASYLSEKLGTPYKYRIYGHGMSNIDYAYATNERYQLVFRNMLPIDFNIIHKIPTNAEWAVLFLERQSLLNSEKTKIDFEKGTISLTAIHKKALAMQAVRYIVSDVEIIDPDLTEIKTIPFPSDVNHVFYVGAVDGMQKVEFPVSGVHIYENRYFYPRAYLTDSIINVKSPDEAFESVFKNDFNPPQNVILEGRENVTLEKGSSDGKKDDTREVFITEDQQDKLTFKTSSDRESILVLADTYYPGWKATVDGKETALLRVNYAFKGVKVGEGEHTVVFSYEPTYKKRGLAVSLTSLILFLVFTIAVTLITFKNIKEKQ